MLKSAGQAFQHEHIMLRNKIAEENYDLVIKLADLMHYKHPDIAKEDLQSFGAYGLLDAISKYDPNTGYKFETFATYRIFGSMYDEMRKSSWAPRLVRQRQAIVDLHREKFISANGRAPNQEELIDVLKDAEVEKPERVARDGVPRGLLPIGVGGVLDFDMANESWFAVDAGYSEGSSEDEETIYNLVVDDVGVFAARIVSLIYGRNMTREEVASDLNVDHEHIDKIHKEALKKLNNSDVLYKIMNNTKG
jgi:RNA polymerase sigma factor for flagellar operon FliA